MTTTTLYQHPAGATLTYSASVLTATGEGGLVVRMPIDLEGLIVLIEELEILVNDGGDTAEQSGAAAARDCIDTLLLTDSPGERIHIVQAAIEGLQHSTDPERAIGGFAVVLASVIRPGVEVLE